MTAALVVLVGVMGLAAAASAGDPKWYRGQIHAHSLWSDGDEFPEMAAEWYKSHGFDFLAFTDHDHIQRGERWAEVSELQNRYQIIDRCRARFGKDWVQTRVNGLKFEARLKTMEEYRGKVEEPGKFILMDGVELTVHKSLHLNLINPREFIAVAEGADLPAVLANTVAKAQAAARTNNGPLLAIVNHPNWRPLVTAESLAACGAAFFEVANNCWDSVNEGDKDHPDTDRLWDITSALRIAMMHQAPLWGVGSDDAHQYHTFADAKANPERGWVMVRSAELTTKALLEAMQRGDFYASTGVELEDLTYDRAGKTLKLKVKPQPGRKYTIRFIGTPAGTDLQGKERVNSRGEPLTREYPADVGKVLEEVQGTSATYTLKGTELYVRAVVLTDHVVFEARGVKSFEQAWTQPVGWEK